MGRCCGIYHYGVKDGGYLSLLATYNFPEGLRCGNHIRSKLDKYCDKNATGAVPRITGRSMGILEVLMF